MLKYQNWVKCFLYLQTTVVPNKATYLFTVSRSQCFRESVSLNMHAWMYTGPLVWPLINPSLTHGCLVLYAHWLQRRGSKKFTAVNPGHTKRSSVTAGYTDVCIDSLLRDSQLVQDFWVCRKPNLNMVIQLSFSTHTTFRKVS